MRICWIRIEGFRNFDVETINFTDKTLIIGPNDVGKSNMIFALRLLFDKSLSEKDLELCNSDYNAYKKSDEIKITVCLDKIKEDCLKSIFAGDIENESLIIQYRNSKVGEYSIFTGPIEKLIEQKTSRFYLKRLNLEYVNSNRDLFSFMKRIKVQLLEKSKDSLEASQKENDKSSIEIIQKSLNTLNNDINNLNYIKNSLSVVNKELSDLSIHSEGQTVKFTTENNDVDDLLTDLELSYSTKDCSLKIGGDGRNNQIFLATWVSKQKLERTLERVTFFAIEEPEAHLHPHQQRKLSKYLLESFDEQIFITTHSPQIASEFKPNNIVRLYCKNKLTKVAQGGCSKKIAINFKDFGYRLNAISSEVFFSSAVFLVEGPSEKLFYTALANDLSVDLDKYNAIILAVDGVGFKPYIKICKALEIPFIMRTDNDIAKKSIKGVEYLYYSGVSRVIGIYKELISTSKQDTLLQYWKNNYKKNQWIPTQSKSSNDSDDLNSFIKKEIKKSDIFLSEVDLENDLIATNLHHNLLNFYKCKDTVLLLERMQSRKAEYMLSFLEYLQQNNISLSMLKNDPISFPIIRLKEIVEEVAKQ